MVPVGNLPAADGLRKNIVVLVDVSKSVDPENQTSALKLVAGLVSGTMPDDVLNDWKFTAKNDDSLPAVLNLRRLGEKSTDPCQPLAAPQAKFIANPLGNYERVTDLRRALGAPASGTPESIAAALTAPGVFGSTDNSTHLTLAQAAVAKAFLSSDSRIPYYLIVISDFHEDCVNSTIDAYEDMNKRAELEKINSGVFSGKSKYNDGKGEHEYNSEDISDIASFKATINDIKLGMFEYQKSGTDLKKRRKLPVNVEIYSPSKKSKLAFAEGTSARWILPDPPPSLRMDTGSLDPGADLKISLKTPDGNAPMTLTERCSLVTAGGALDLGDLFGRPEFKTLRMPGSYRIVLQTAQDIGPDLTAETTFEIVEPQLHARDQAMDVDAKADGERSGDPYDFPPNTVINNQQIAFELRPPPTQSHKLTVTCGNNRELVEINGGSGQVILGKLIENVSVEDKPIHITADLRLLDDPVKSTSKEVWLRIPHPSIWAEYDGTKIQDREAVTLKGGLGLQIKANLDSMKGMEWGDTYITGPDGQKIKSRVPESVTFMKAEPGNYTVEATFGSEISLAKATFTVTIPPRTNWLLIALGGMAVISLALFGWHFIRRRTGRTRF